MADHASTGLGRSLVSLVVMLALVAGCYFLLRSFVIGSYEVPSGSMEETIQPSDRLFSEKISYYSRDVQAGEIVTFIDPEDSSRTLIKRCIATGGQTVDLVDGSVVVDGVTLSEPYTQGKPSYPLQGPMGNLISYPFTVPDGYLWMMGDNRTNSADSRYFGAVPESSVSGRACLIFWPLDRIGTL